MIYLFYGSDVERVRAKAFAFVAAARAKSPDLSYVRLTKEELTPGALMEAAQTGGLFVKRLLILIDDPFAKARAAEEEEDGEGSEGTTPIEEHLAELAASDNAIVLLAPKLASAKAKKIAVLAAKSYAYDAPPRGLAARGFNGDLVNALGMRSRERLWLELVRALRAGDAPEALHGLLHWKARDLMQKGSRAWSVSDARALSLALITLLQESRRTGADLARSLERFALSI